MELPQTIPDFFAGQNVLVTGASGFIGKVLLEKLLRSCTNVNKIFVILRSKRGKSIEERMESLRNCEIFDFIRERRPKMLKKIVGFSGDLKMDRLGLSNADLKTLQSTNIIFHAAASVRFDDTLTDAIRTNVKSTKELIDFALGLQDLKVFLHVSTTYCNSDHSTIKERIYPSHVSWKKALQIVDLAEEGALSALSKHYSDFMPNTYTFTKGLAENIIQDFAHQLPFAIYRPSIVIPSEVEPMPGWIDNFNGPVGVMVGCGTGILRTFCVPQIGEINAVPVDMCVRGMIIAAWKRATIDPPQSLPVYNSASIKRMSYVEMLKLSKENTKFFAFDQVIWRPGGRITTNPVEFYFRVIPAIFVDLFMLIMGKKPFLLKYQRLIYRALVSLKFFLKNVWNIPNDKFLDLSNQLIESDKPAFNLEEKWSSNEEYLKHSAIGVRRYLMKQKDADLFRAKKKLDRMILLDRLLKYIAVALILWAFLSKMELATVAKTIYKIDYSNEKFKMSK